MIKEIKRLPVDKRLVIIEQALKSIREHDLQEKMEKAADKLDGDYRTDNELTSFTAIDFEHFYETRSERNLRVFIL